MSKDDVEKAVRRVMVGTGEETMDMRRRACELSSMAKKAVEEGGSSFSDLNSLIQALRMLRMTEDMGGSIYRNDDSADGTL